MFDGRERNVCKTSAIINQSSTPMPPERPAQPAWRGRWRRLRALPPVELAWALPAWVMLGLARALVLMLPLRRLAPMLGVDAGAQPWLPLLDAREEARARMIGRVVRRSARFTPWRSNCFNQAITARLLLGLYRVPYVLFFGAAPQTDAETGSSGLSAHAWIAAGRVQVTGDSSFEQYPVLGCFVARRLASKMSAQLPR